jgi:exosortase H (IPTLxxWG-CTERM-specific)
VGDDPARVTAGLRGIRRDARPGALAIQRTRFLLLFVVILVALFAAELTRPVQATFVVPWTDALARISATLITLFDPHVASFGKIVQSTANGFAISIEAGCNGIEAALILIAAMLAFPAPWKHRAIGIGAGLLAVQLLNIVRVVSLFYLGQWSLRAFEWAHLYLWQALIMIDVLVVWLIWIRTLPPAPRVPLDGETRQASAA